MRAAFSVVFFCFVVLTGCDMSPEERANIALASCNVLSEYAESDRAQRLKEMNAAREKLNEPLFLGSSEDIQEALLHEVCTALVLNDSAFEVKLVEAKELRAQKFAEFLEGHWVDYSKAERSEDPFIYVAKFTGEKLILNAYIYDRVAGIERVQKSVFLTRILDEATVIASRAQGDNFLVSVDWDSKTLHLNFGDCANTDGCTFEKPLQLTAGDLSGKWLYKEQIQTEGRYEIDDDSMLLIEYSFPAINYVSRNLNHKTKTFERGSSKCEFTLEGGFIFTEKCTYDGDTTFEWWFIKEYNHQLGEMKIQWIGGTWLEARIGDSYTFPEPPEGYTNATKN